MQNPDCTTICTKSAESLALMASEEALAGLVESVDDALLSRLEPGLRFVVQHWPELSEGDQRAILAIVRRAESLSSPTILSDAHVSLSCDR